MDFKWISNGSIMESSIESGIKGEVKMKEER
jgi:hypothetical protein